MVMRVGHFINIARPAAVATFDQLDLCADGPRGISVNRQSRWLRRWLQGHGQSPRIEP